MDTDDRGRTAQALGHGEVQFRRPNLKEEVGRYVRGLILSGELRPGDKIDQDAVASQLRISRLPVREALITLETEGLVENIARRGAFVAPLTPDDLRDHYVIYGLLSGMACERAAHILSIEDTGRLQDLVKQMETVKTAAEQTALNFSFHSAINKAGSSRRLLSVLRVLANNVPENFFEFTTGWSDRALEDHRRIAQALADKDAEAAGKAMREHLSAGGEYAVRALEERGFWRSAVQAGDGA